MVPYLDIHVFSAVLFIVVGILLTHAIYLGSSTPEDDQDTNQSVSQLTVELTHHRSVSDEHRVAKEQLQVEYEATQRDWLSLRQENEHLRTREQDRQRAWASQDAGLRKLQEFKHDALISLEQERHRRTTAETGLRSANATISQLRSEVAGTAVGRQKTEGHSADRLRCERDEIKRKHREEVQRRQELEESLTAKQRVIKQLAADSQSLKSMREKQAVLQETREADMQKIKALQEEVQRLESDNQTVLEQVRSLEGRLESEHSAIGDRENEKQELARRVDEQREKIFALETALTVNSQTAADLDRSRVESAALRSRIKQLEAARDQEVHRTQQQLIALRQRRQLSGDDPGTAVDSGGTRRDSRLGSLYTEEPEQKDDLKRITGVTEVVQQRLNDFGVYTYRQVMEWDSIAVEEFTHLLAVTGGIILSDDWMSQARALHAKHHGQAA